MECKKALEASKGDIEAAIEELRKSGVAKAGKKAVVLQLKVQSPSLFLAITKKGIMIEVNSETDFVARDANFTNFVKAVGETALQNNIADVAALSAAALQGKARRLKKAVWN